MSVQEYGAGKFGGRVDGVNGLPHFGLASVLTVVLTVVLTMTIAATTPVAAQAQETAAPGESAPVPAYSSAALIEGITWQLRSVSRDGVPEPVPEGSAVTLVLDGAVATGRMPAVRSQPRTKPARRRTRMAWCLCVSSRSTRREPARTRARRRISTSGAPWRAWPATT